MTLEQFIFGTFSAADKARTSREVLKGKWTLPLESRSGFDDFSHRLLDGKIKEFLDRNGCVNNLLHFRWR
jgi:hypothetical protein